MTGVRQVSAGSVHILAVMACGVNSSGQLGIGNRDDQLRPVRIAAKVGDFAAGEGVSLWITPAGELEITGNITGDY